MLLTNDADKSPCDPGCSERSAECHAHCQRYAKYRKRMDEKAEEKFKKTYLHTPDLPRAMKKDIWRGIRAVVWRLSRNRSDYYKVRFHARRHTRKRREQ